MSNLINLNESERRIREKRRLSEIRRNVYPGSYKMFDKWITKEAMFLTVERIEKIQEYMSHFKDMGCDLSEVIHDVLIFQQLEFEEIFGINWLDCLEVALVYYAGKKRWGKGYYDVIMSHAFIGIQH